MHDGQINCDFHFFRSGLGLLMIKFVITIQEEKSGFVAIRAETPPGVASPREIDFGLKFKSLVKELAERHGAAAVNNWQSPHNEAKGNN
jgi:hypothetical protein